MGLARRRHFATRGRVLLDIEDELFGDAAAALGLPTRRPAGQRHLGPRRAHLARSRPPARASSATSPPPSRASRTRSSGPRCPGVLVVQGGPGTGKTVVALHRAAYLLYTHRFPLEGQGVLVVGPNRLFLGYIEQVLPSLGEAGVELAVLADLVDGVAVQGRDTAPHRPGQGRPAHGQGAAPGRARPRAAAAPRPGGGLRPDPPAHDGGRERAHRGRGPAPLPPPQRRPPLRRGRAVRRAGPQQPRGAVASGTVRDRLRGTPEVREALEWMWPVLTPAQLLHDLYGSRALLRNAGRGLLVRRRVRPRWSGPRSDDGRRRRVDQRRRPPARRGPGPARPQAAGPPAGGDGGRRRGPHLRPHRGRRGPGPVAHAAAHARTALAQRLDDRRRRHRPVDRRVGPRQLAGDPRPPARPPPAPPGRAHRRLPAAGAQHGAGVAGAARGRSRSQPPRSIREDGDPPRILRADADELGAPWWWPPRSTSSTRSAPATWRSSCRPRWSTVVSDAFTAGRASSSAGPPATASTPRSPSCRSGLVKGLELDASVVVEPAAIVRGGGAGPAGALRGPHPGHQAPGHRARRRPARGPAGVAERRAARPVTPGWRSRPQVMARRPEGRQRVVTRMRVLAKVPMPTWLAVDLDGAGAVGRRRGDLAPACPAPGATARGTRAARGRTRAPRGCATPRSGRRPPARRGGRRRGPGSPSRGWGCRAGRWSAAPSRRTRAASTGSEMTCSHLPASAWASAHDRPEDVGQEPLGQAVAAHHALGQAQAVVGQADGAVDGDQALLLHAVDHLRHRRARHVEPLGDAGLDDVDVVLAELEDGLAVLLEGRVVLGRLVRRHRVESRSGGAVSTGRPWGRSGTGRHTPPVAWVR